jgi:hypothetical protein
MELIKSFKKIIILLKFATLANILLKFYIKDYFNKRY